MNQAHVVIAGGNGFLGKALANELVQKGRKVAILTRTPDGRSGPVEQIGWDGKTLGDWARLIDGAAAVVNLTGKSVNCRYTPENLREINESRTNSVRVIDEAIRCCANPPKVLVQASSLAIYGDAGQAWCYETTPPGAGIPVDTCLQWEGAANPAATPKTRRVVLRIGIVLAAGEGGLKVLARLAGWGLGGTVGRGDQFLSWIHVEDMNRMFLWAVEKETASGVYNATGPNPVPNREFMRSLRAALHRPWSPPAPVWAVHIGCWLMGTEPCLALTGRRGAPRRFLEAGFEFKFPDLLPALKEIFAKPPGN